MDKFIKIITKLTEYISYSGKTKRELPEFIMRYEYYMNLPEMEFILSYLNLCKRLKRAELSLYTIFAIIVLIVFMNISENIVDLIIISFQDKQMILNEYYTAIGFVSITILFAIIIITTTILYIKIKTIADLNKEKMLIEMVKEAKKEEMNK